ncbi:MAG: aspartyl protease family protein [Bacteroidota bacterium]|nr:aspartyl protease family protein [Bacteroidota bacterium]MDP4248897.1 aspartyl protease family protein [Bacteroidota bacterium]
MSIHNRHYPKFPVAACRKIASLFLLLHFYCLPVSAQKPLPATRSRLITQVPFTTFTGGVVVIKMQLAGYPDTLNFIMDTGSGGISLDSMACQRLNIVPTPTDRFIIGIGGVRKVKFIYNQAINIGSLKVDSLNFHVSDYGVLSSVYGDRIDGIIGFSFFSRYIVKIDYDSNLVSIYTRGSFKYPKGGFYLKPSIVNIPVEPAYLKDGAESHSRFYFDTGAGLCLLLSSDFANDSSIFNPGKRMWPTQAQGMGGKADMKITTVKEFRLGPYHFRNVPTHVFGDEYNITSYPYLGGLIGNDLLRRFNVILNYDKKILYLMPNTRFREPFDYSYTGLALYWTDGAIRVGDVMKDSPAELAGFKVDDVVISINNNTSQNLQVYKSMMQDAGSKIKFIVSRPEGLVELTMKIKSIL